MGVSIISRSFQLETLPSGRIPLNLPPCRRLIALATEDRLIGAVIVGTGLPQVCTDREIVRRYFEEHGMAGFDYAYLYPGMNKVLQSAGRVIRTERDRGLILLLDDRFQQRQYRETFPREWEGRALCAEK